MLAMSVKRAKGREIRLTVRRAVASGKKKVILSSRNTSPEKLENEIAAFRFRLVEGVRRWGGRIFSPFRLARHFFPGKPDTNVYLDRRSENWFRRRAVFF